MRHLNKFANHPDRQKLLSNFLNFILFKASQYIVPLITMPYIIRVIGLEYFGIVSLAQAVASYFRIGADYGWTILGVQYIARTQNDDKKRSDVVSNILMIQFILAFLGLAILIVLATIIKPIKQEWLVFFAAFAFVPANIMLAPWFFVGMEKVKFLNYVNLVGRIIYLILIFALLGNKSQYVLVPLFNSLSITIAGMLSIILMIRKFNVKLKMPTLKKIISYLKDGWPIFLSYFSISFYRNMNILILALFTTKEIVGIFSAADKIVKIVQRTFEPITQTLYPYISRIKDESEQRAKTAIKYLSIIMSILGGTAVVLLILFAPWIIFTITDQTSILGTRLLQIGSIVVLFGILNYIIGIIYMTNFGMKKQFSKSVVLTGILNLIACFVLSYYFNAVGAMLSFSSAEAFLLLSFLFHIYISRSKLTVGATNG